MTDPTDSMLDYYKSLNSSLTRDNQSMKDDLEYERRAHLVTQGALLYWHSIYQVLMGFFTRTRDAMSDPMTGREREIERDVIATQAAMDAVEKPIAIKEKT